MVAKSEVWGDSAQEEGSQSPGGSSIRAGKGEKKKLKFRVLLDFEQGNQRSADPG